MRKKILYLFTLLITVILIPTIVNAKELEKYAKDRKIVFKSIKPKNIDELVLFQENLFYPLFEDGEGFIIDIDSCNSDFTKCTFEENGNKTELEIVYEYDENIKKTVDSLVSKLPADKDTYNLTEMELISFIYNNSDDLGSIADFSGELKKYMEYKNYGIDVRLGDDSSFYTMRGGNALFTYNGTIYYNSEQVMHVESKHIFYVPTDTTNVVEAMQARLKKNFQNLTFEIEEMTFNEFIDYRKNQLIPLYDDPDYEWVKGEYNNAEEFAQDWVNGEYLNDDAAYPHVKNEEKVYHITVNGKELREDFPVFFIVKKDSSKIVDNELITIDSASNVTITTKETIPLDTLIQVSKITSGEEYDKIVKILSVTNNEMFDLKLFSKSTGENITKLDNGTFEVRIPISDKLKGKNLVVYYVDANNNIRIYEVTIKDDFAIFYTDHFSIYTLAEQQEEKEPVYKLTFNFNGGLRQGEKEYIDESVAIGFDVTKANFIDELGVTPPEGKELDAIEINGTRVELGGNYLLNKDTVFNYLWKDSETTFPDKGEPVPQTFDNINSYITMLIISTIILIGTIAISKRKLRKNK